MYLSLAKDLSLRGWEGKAWVLVRDPYKITRVLNMHEFQMLMLCDGETDVTDDMLTPEMQDALSRLKKQNMVSVSDVLRPIEKWQHYRYYTNKYMDTILWSITGRCNFRCRHCYMDAPDAALGELSHEDAMKLIEQMAECGVQRVDITGGEPFVRQDFWELIDHILYCRMTVTQIYTNTWLLTAKTLDEFEKRGLRPEFCISFDGVGWHDWMRGIEGAEEAALNAIQLCNERGFPVTAEMCLHKGNLGSLRETVKTLGRLGVISLKASDVSETELWKKNSEGNSLGEREYIDAMLEYIPYFYEDGMPINLTLGGVINLNRHSTEYHIVPLRMDGTEKCKHSYLCGSARHNGYITPEGRLLPCMPMTSAEEQTIFPLIRDVGMRNGLRDSFYMKYIDQRVDDLLKVNEKCNACAHKYECGGGCRARALLGKERDLMGCDYGQCFMFENSYPDKIRAVADAAIAKYCPDAKKDNE